MSQYCQGTQKPDDTWALHGLAVRAAIRIGLHSPSVLAKFDGVEREVRKRVWCGCRILDRFHSLLQHNTRTFVTNQFHVVR